MRSKQALSTQQTQTLDTELPPPRNLRSTGSSITSVDSGAAAAPGSAVGLRELGNVAFKDGKFAEAAELYTRSLVAGPTAATYANRAMASLKLERWEAAEEDCTSALALEPHYVKALQRRGTARRELGRLYDAACDFDTVARLEPHNKAMLKERQEAVAAYERQTGTPMTRPRDVSVPIRQLAQPPVEVVTASSTPKGKGTIVDVQHGESWEAVRNAADDKTVLLHVTSPRTSPRADVTAGGPPPSSTETGVPAAAIAALASLPMSAPKTAADFEAAWKRARGKTEMELQLLQLVEPAAVPALVKETLTPATLCSAACGALTALMPHNPARAMDYLRSLSRVSRFQIVTMLLSTAEKAELSAAWDTALAASSGTDDLRDLRSIFHI